MTTMTLTHPGRELEAMLRRITDGHETVILKRGRKTVAVMLPPDVLEALEDMQDIRAADRTMSEYEKDPSRAVPLEHVKREAGLA